MKYSWIIVIGIGLLLISCGNPKPRHPVMRTGRMDMSESISYNKRQLKYEEQLLSDFMKKDSTHSYINSQNGFWYTYEIKNEEDSKTPVKGEEVSFTYDIKSVDGSIIYSQEDLGIKTLLIDQEDFIKGVHEGIKLMKVDEKVIFLLPSLKAYSIQGDRNKIKSNTPLIVTVELLEIKNR